MEQEKMLTMEEAAKELGLTLSSVRRYVRTRKLHGVIKRGRNYFAPASEVARLLAGTPVEEIRRMRSGKAEKLQPAA